MQSLRLVLIRVLICLASVFGILALSGVSAAPDSSGAAVSQTLATKEPGLTAPIPAAADIWLDKLGPGSAYPGQYFVYYIDLRNAGTVTTTVTLTDTFSMYVNWVSTHPATGVSCNTPVERNIVCSVASLPPGLTVLRAVTLTMQIDSSVPGGTAIVNVAQALSPDDPGGVKFDTVYTQVLNPPTPTPTPAHRPTATPTPTATPAPPDNDDFASAFVAAAAPYRFTEDTTGATTQAEDPLQSCTYGGPMWNYHSVWFAYTPVAAQRVAVLTAGSDYDTVLSVHTGTWGSLVEIACSDDILPFRQSRVYFDAVAGETYYLDVTSYTLEAGTLVFQMFPVLPPAFYMPAYFNVPGTGEVSSR